MATQPTPKNPRDEVAALQHRLQNAEKQAKENEKKLQEEISKLQGADLTDDDKAVLKHLCEQEQGIRYNKLEETMGWKFNRLKHTLDKLKKHDFTKVRGGGEVPTYIEANDAGVAYAVREKLI